MTSIHEKSTPTARTFSTNRLFRLLRIGLKTSEAFAPGLAVRAAARVFCTPVPTKLSSRRALIPARVRVETWPFENANLTLYRWPVPEGAPLILLTHGWGGWGLQLAPIASALCAGGMAPVLIDLPGHGRSAAWSSTLPQFVRALHHVTAKLGRVDAMVGHSMGGSAAAIAVANGLALRKLVMIASPTSMVQMAQDYASAFGLRETTCVEMVRHLEMREGMLFNHMAARHVAPSIGTPTLLVHDTQDSMVPYAETVLLSKLLSNAELLSTEGLGHGRILKDPAVIAKVAQFLK